MKFTNVTHETVCEMLLYLIENDKFESLKNYKLFEIEEVKDILQQIVAGLRREASEEGNLERVHHTNGEISQQAQSIISCLSPREEMLLFKSFKLL